MVLSPESHARAWEWPRCEVTRSSEGSVSEGGGSGVEGGDEEALAERAANALWRPEGRGVWTRTGGAQSAKSSVCIA